MGTREEKTSVRSKARFVDPIVDIVIGPDVCPFNLCSQCLREKVNALVLFRNYVIEFCIEHADDLAGLNVGKISSSVFLFRIGRDAPHC